MYTKYNTISMLPAEIMEAYCDKMTIEKIETLYEKVKQRFLELPEEDVQMQLEQMGQFLQSMLIGKNIAEDKVVPATMPKIRPRLNAKCVNCQHTTYLQFTDGYYCPNCKKVHVEHLDKNKILLKDMFLRLQHPSELKSNEELYTIQEMLKLDGDSASIYLRLGYYYYRQTDYEKALEYYKKALELDERDGAIYAEMGFTYIGIEAYDQASVCLEKAFHQWKKGEYSRWNSTSLFANYAIALQKTGNHEKAFELFKMARDAGYPANDVLVETHEIGKRFYESKIKELMYQAIRTYSENYKVDFNTLKRVRKYFMVSEKAEIIGFFDYTVFGSSREGIAVTTDGIYFKTLMPKVVCIKWYELFQFDMEYKNCIQLKEKKGNNETMEICFQTLLDATKFMEVMKKMQNL